MINAKARAVSGPDSNFFATEIERRDLDTHDVLIEIKYAGICHSDIHTARLFFQFQLRKNWNLDHLPLLL